MFSPRVEEILDELLELPAPERAARLEILCLEDDPIRREVASLLAAYEGAGSFLTPTLRGRLHPSDRIGRYRIVAEIGRGAMGIVYLAEDSDLGRNVALKTLTSAAAGDRQRRQRLHAEARMLAAVSQPNIAQVYSFEELPSESVDSVITMEYVPGSTLADKLRNASLSVESTIEFVRQIAAALEAAHAEGVVHRDLKPQNIRITPNGWVKVLDFGLAFHREREPGGAGFPCGTAGYMSPEQAAGVPVEPSTDLWSLGCILFECLTGRLPLTDRETLAEARTALSPVEAARLESLPTAVIELLDGLRRWNPVERPSATRSRRILEEELLRLRARALLHDPTGRPSQETESPPGRPGNLPRRLTEFVGRDRALSELDRVLREHRIVTLTGPGGTGKTRLAIERAKRSRDQYPGGTWFIDLSIVDVGSQVPATAAHALGVRDAPGDAADPIGSIARFLSGNAALVVVDNCEHVIDDVYRWVDEVLDRCPGVTVLATSRLPLGLAEERLFVVPPLRVPDGADSAALASSEAIQLFAARARSRHPSFQLHEDQIATIAAICRRADGLPLAIEIAAGHARTLAVPEILARFEANPLLLGTPARGAPARHRSLAGTVQWSYRLLGRSERLLLERLSAFRGSWTLEAAQSVCVREGLSEWQLLDLIARLVERSLVEVDSLDREQQARYRLLETIQRFAHDRLVRRTDEPEATEERYVAYYLEQVTPRSDEPEVNERWLARVDAERANLQQALSIAIRRGWYARAFSLAAHLTRYWVTAGLWREGGDTLRKLLELRES
ncbi:MAG: protein kinase, partial [Candidatus Eisenbacteria bacterium]|nr:protein kinase [Candidatus Eisenbacteria bacterium]